MPTSGARRTSRTAFVLLQLFVFVFYAFAPTASLAEEPTPEPTQTESTAPEPTTEPTAEPTLAPEPTPAPTTAPEPEPTTAPTQAPEPTPAPAAEMPASTEPVTAPSIASDKDDYRPGELVTLTGSNWAPGEVVHIRVNDDVGQTWRRDVDVVADADGRIGDQFNLPDWFVAQYFVTATGPVSGIAQTTFTDGTVGARNATTTPGSVTIAYRLDRYDGAACEGSVKDTKSFSRTGTPTAGGGSDTIASGGTESVRVSITSITAGFIFDKWNFVDGNTSGDGAFYSTASTICFATENNTNRTFIAFVKVANRAPVADDETVTATEDTDLDTPVSTLLAGDTDADGDTLTVTAVSGATGGTATLMDNGTPLNKADDFVRFDPADNLCGPGAGSYSYTVSDGNGGSDLGQVTVNITCVNDAPVVRLAGVSSTTEGSTEEYTYTVSDVDSASLTITESCGLNGTRTDTAAANQFTCTFSDGLASSAVSVTADDGGSENNVGSDEIDVTVANVAPSITKPANQTASEGTSSSFDLGSFTDPGDDDPWTVIVDWGDGSTNTEFTEASAGDITDKAHTYADDGTYTVTLTVREEPGSTTAPSDSETFTITVANVAPSISPLVVTPPTGVACQGTTNVVRLQFSVSDPAAEAQDPINGLIDWGDGTPLQSYSGRSVDATHAYAAGTYTITVTAADGDGGTDTEYSATNAVSILYQVSGVLQPVNDTQAKNDPSIFKYGNTIPVKVRVTDCNGAGVTNLAPRISVVKTAGSTPPTGTEETITNTNSPDSNGIMRSIGDGVYLYNLATKSLSDSTATYEIRINGPFATVTALFGTKAK